MATDFNDEDVPESGAVFTFGRTRFSDNVNSKFWIKNDSVVEVACGDEHSAVVSSSGRLYTFGSNDWGQLGHGHNKTCNKPSFVKALKHETVKLVACGRSHTVVATESGCLYSFGAGSEGQLGLNSTESFSSPKLISALEKQQYKALSCGTEHSTALTSKTQGLVGCNQCHCFVIANGCLYMWGSDSEGQLGLASEGRMTPTVLDIGYRIKHVSCGYYHTAIVTSKGVHMCLSVCL
jgi:X-linked retinitis pigmentosa GTPase regulator